MHPAAQSALKILLDTSREWALRHILTDRSGKLLEVGILQGMLVVEDVIVHLPEFPLSVCSLGSERGVQRVRMDFGEREVAIDKTQLVPELLLNGLDNPCRAPGIGAFVVAVLHERDRGRVRPLNVVPLADGNRKMCSLCHGLLSFAGAFWQTYSVRGSQSGSAKSSQSWSA